jgi:antitoxin VapB
MRLEITPIAYNYTMALNIKDPETVRLAAEVASLAGESKTKAVRQALAERKQRLLLEKGGGTVADRLTEWLEREVWPTLPPGVRGSSITKEEEEDILGFGPDGV